DRGPYTLYEDGRRRRLMMPDADQLARLDQERLAEDVRKLYVALTRARHAVWMALGPVRGLEGETAVGHVFGVAGGGVRQGLEDLVEAHAAIAWDAAQGPATAVVRADVTSPALGPARVPVRPARGPA